MEPELPDNIRSVKYKVSVEFKTLHLNKNIQFETKILWKRNKNRAETKTVTHRGGQSVFNQTLMLEFSMYFDANKNCFLEKMTEIAPVISIDGKVKSGGSAKVDIAEPLNANFGGINQSVEKRIPLMKCPDPDAYIDAVFYYELIDGEQGSTDMSIMNTSTQDANTSRFEFPPDPKNQQPVAIQSILTASDKSIISNPIKKLHLTIGQFQSLFAKIRQRNSLPPALVAQAVSLNSPKLNMQMEMIQGQNARLRTTIQSLEQKVSETELNWRNQKRDLQKQNLDLEKMIDKKSREINEKVKEIIIMQQSISQLQSAVKNDDSTDVSNSNRSNFEEMYQSMKVKYDQSQRQIQELKVRVKDLSQTIQHVQLKNQSFDMDFGKDFGAQPNENFESNQKVQVLTKQNQQLQEKLVETSNKIGQLFNVALQIGGAKLLDKLQVAIGLIQNLDV